MYIHIDYHSGEPIYRQIVEEIKYQIACGRLAGGECLPSIRALARQLKINPRTVVCAYDELQHEGLVVMKQGQGVFVADHRESIPLHARRKALGEMVKRLLSEAHRIGADVDEVLEILKAESEEMEPTK